MIDRKFEVNTVVMKRNIKYTKYIIKIKQKQIRYWKILNNNLIAF